MSTRTIGVRHPTFVDGIDGGAEPSFSIIARLVLGVLLGGCLLIGVGGWAATTDLNGAIMAPGAVTVDQNAKAVQHRDGGVVGSILVRDGQAVTAGQVLIRIDDAQTRAELAIIRGQLVELSAKKARLLAERDGLRDIAFPPSLSNGDGETLAIIDGESRLFRGNLASRDSQRQQLELQIGQVDEEVAGLVKQKDAKRDELAILTSEHGKLQGLVDKHLFESSKFLPISRDRHRLTGEQGSLEASIARARVRTSEIRVQLLAIADTARTEAQKELSVVDAKLAELGNRRIALEDRLTRTEIRSPASGILHELKAFTVGGVVTPADVLATVVPADAPLRIEIRISPASIDQIGVGRPAKLRFTAFNQRTTPELKGKLVYVSPSTTKVGKDDAFYVGYVELNEGELTRLGERARLVPGMPVEVHVTTEERTALSYLVKPIQDQFTRSFRER
ncbi:HlyD family type I secretion periplasmic adaptor subunit [Methylobacterium gnaphalii]|uniref:Membrane fusion protein (MFP) family protein n=1 Tax=Methylobacterium gnaphalii TaxID=1010610 RepID=A0A512JRL2_9HYPH|nr:HlyD family type I secretion periplasmic adaptor subunit [Methylobacterium gnaphalii]GEP12552.1 HlyD family type I secretion periplasmic adaptor subunit [Methylobacterium gnaphalii]GJD71723.1 Type I secretion system membrane fusion protein PrsE [Methylobacterium gnaphalii]GLS48769.1 HlyD family type I secretion periplasmic adaptor subunit [Methylobacterium gnaphalii]